MTAVGSRITDQFVLFVKGLRQIEGLLGAEAEQAIGVSLEFSQIVKKRWLLTLRPGFDRLDGCFACLRSGDNGVRVNAVDRQAFFENANVAVLATVRTKRGVDLEIFLGNKAANRQFAVDDHCQG